MNGRVNDPKLHQFLAPDNHIQDPYNTMSYDRFGYVMNNPLGNVDPSGEELITALVIIGKAIAVYSAVRTANGYVTGYFKGPTAAITAALRVFAAFSGFSEAVGNTLFASGATTGAGAVLQAGIAAGVSEFILGFTENLIRTGDLGHSLGQAAKGAGIAAITAAALAGFQVMAQKRNSTMRATAVDETVSDVNGNSTSSGQQIGETRYFDNKRDAYDYAMEESILLDMGNGNVIDREVSGYALKNGDYIVLDSTKNTRTISYNKMILKRGRFYAKYNGELYAIESQFHTHPSGTNHVLGRIGVSKYDLKLMFNILNSDSMSILYRGNEWIVNPGNQFSKYGYNYSLRNNGSW